MKDDWTRTPERAGDRGFMYGIQLSLSLSLIQVLRNEIFSPFGIFSFFLLEYLGRQGGSGARKGKARQAFRETRRIDSYYKLCCWLPVGDGSCPFRS